MNINKEYVICVTEGASLQFFLNLLLSNYATFKKWKGRANRYIFFASKKWSQQKIINRKKGPETSGPLMSLAQQALQYMKGFESLVIYRLI